MWEEALTSTDVSQLHETIEKIRSDIALEKVQREADVETCVYALLRCLGWDPMDLDSVRRQYTVPRCRFDFALLTEKGEVAFVIEAKAPGKLDDKSTHQLLGYAGITKTNLGLTTDGAEWSFYLPLAAGTPKDKLVRTVNLRTDPAGVAGGVLSRYLERRRVLSGDAHEAACGDLASLVIHGIVETGWAELVDGSNTGLVRTITAAAKRAATRKGVKPGRALNDAVRAFIRHGFEFPADLPAVDVDAPRRARLPAEANRAQRSKSGAAWTYRGERRVEKNPTEVFVAVVGHLYETRGGVSFYKKLQEEIRGPKRLQIARTPEDTGVIGSGARRLPGGWYINTNLNTATKLRYLERACKVAGVAFGSDLVIEIAETHGAEPRS